MSESELIEQLLTDRIRPAEMFTGIRGVPSNACWKTSVSLQTIPGERQGDIDVILCDPARPHEAVAYEVKRIKFGTPALRPGGKPNKLKEVKKATQQANRLAEIGFWKVFLYLIVVVDSRERNSGTVSYEGLSAYEKSMIEPYLKVSELDSGIGYSVLACTQPTDNPPFSVGSLNMQLRRLPVPAQQDAQLTRWVEELFA